MPCAVGALELKRKFNYRFLDHTADIGLEASAPDCVCLFAAAAEGLRTLIFGTSEAEQVIQYQVHLTAGDRAELLIAWLNEILCLSEMTHLVPAAFEIISVTDQALDAVVSGEPYDPERHHVERVAKAVTYHQLVVEKRNGGWYARVYIDL